MRLIAALFASLITLSAFARIVPNQDPLNGVLDAELVVIAGPSLSGKPGTFRIKEMFLGELPAGDSMILATSNSQLPNNTVLLKLSQSTLPHGFCSSCRGRRTLQRYGNPHTLRGRTSGCSGPRMSLF